MDDTTSPAGAFQTLIDAHRACFTAPGFKIFTTLVTGWVLAARRRSGPP